LDAAACSLPCLRFGHGERKVLRLGWDAEAEVKGEAVGDIDAVKEVTSWLWCGGRPMLPAISGCTGAAVPLPDRYCSRS